MLRAHISRLTSYRFKSFRSRKRNDFSGGRRHESAHDKIIRKDFFFLVPEDSDRRAFVEHLEYATGTFSFNWTLAIKIHFETARRFAQFREQQRVLFTESKRRRVRLVLSRCFGSRRDSFCRYFGGKMSRVGLVLFNRAHVWRLNAIKNKYENENKITNNNNKEMKNR